MVQTVQFARTLQKREADEAPCRERPSLHREYPPIQSQLHAVTRVSFA